MSGELHKRALRVTADGTHTLFLPAWNEHYHSVHGAMAESKHVFIGNGLERIMGAYASIPVLEVGFGTGLNALLTFERAADTGKTIHYLAIEPYPLSENEVAALNHPELVAGGKYTREFLAMHRLPHGEKAHLSPFFCFSKQNNKLREVTLPSDAFLLVYHDAFAPQFQPALWDENAFSKLYEALMPGGLLVTYSARGSVKRALKKCGFRLEHPPGPPGKREMTVAFKNTGV